MNKVFDTRIIVFIVVAMIAVGIGALLIFAPHRETSIDRNGAIQTVIEVHPALADYQSTSLPPSSIEARQGDNGWDIGFIQRGSGVSGILNAQCYHVGNKHEVTSTGTYTRSTTTAQSIELTSCMPVYDSVATSTPSTTSSQVHSLPGKSLPYGTVTLKLNESAVFKGISIRPTAIEEDSRCPQDVQCIQAGTVRVRLLVTTGNDSNVSIIRLGEKFTTQGYAITFAQAVPDKVSTKEIVAADYKLTFKVVLTQTQPVTNAVGKCYVGGCSQQLCTGEANALSTCEYRESYGCYKIATCERQSNGICGWTATQALNACLTNSAQATATFSGTISAFDTSCFSDGICSVTVGDKKVILVTGRRINPQPVGMLKGVDSIGDLENKIGARADVYAAPTTEGGADYTLYGSTAYYVNVQK